LADSAVRDFQGMTNEARNAPDLLPDPTWRDCAMTVARWN
jgi:hypothetical protein